MPLPDLLWSVLEPPPSPHHDPKELLLGVLELDPEEELEEPREEPTELFPDVNGLVRLESRL